MCTYYVSICNKFISVLNVILQVQRQNEPDFIRAINEFSQGNPSPQSVYLIKRLKRRLQPGFDPVYIFGTNVDVNFWNHVQLDNVPDDTKTYTAVDTGETKYLKKCSAAYSLHLKLGCKVIVIRNLPNGLVNGIGATVTEMTDDIITIRTENDEHLYHRLQDKLFNIERYCFIKRKPSNAFAACRTQFPLKLGYAITVDKSQGRTMKHVVVDCYNYWRPGQMAVAIGRCISKKGLQVINYTRDVGNMKHDVKVDNFYKRVTVQPDKNKLCCNNPLPIPTVDNYDNDDDSHFDNMAQIQKKSIHFNKCPLDVKDLLNGLCRDVDTPYQEDKKELITLACGLKSMTTFVRNQYNFVSATFESFKLPGKGKSCNWCFMYAKLHQYFLSPKYFKMCNKAWGVTEVNGIQNSICTELCWAILKQKARKEAKVIIDEQVEQATLPTPAVEVTTSLRGVLRYVAGATLHHLCKGLKRALDRNVSNVYKSKLKYETLKLLTSLRISHSVLSESAKDDPTVREVMRQEGNKQYLTYVSDEMVDFFEVLYKNTIQYQNMQMMRISPQQSLDLSISHLQNDVDCLQQWLDQFNSLGEECNCTQIMDNEPECEEEELPHDHFSWRTHEFLAELVQCMLVDMYDQLVTYFCRVHFSDILGQFRDEHRVKSLPLRMELHAGGKKGQKETYPCAICSMECKSFFKNAGENSVECSSCLHWVHYKCASLTGKEPELQEGNDDPWYCPKCKNEQSVQNGNESQRGQATTSYSTAKGRNRRSNLKRATQECEVTSVNVVLAPKRRRGKKGKNVPVVCPPDTTGVNSNIEQCESFKISSRGRKIKNKKIHDA